MSINSNHDRISQSTSFSHRFTHSPICCFASHTTSDDHHPGSTSLSDSGSDTSSTDSFKSPPSSSQSTSSDSSSDWLKSGARTTSPIKERCASFISKFGRRRRRKRSVNVTADFRYDPLSYALNFDDEATRFDDGEPLRNFSYRLPASPKQSICVAAAAASRQISACS